VAKDEAASSNSAEAHNSAKPGLTPTQKFILTVFGAMVVASVLSIIALAAVNSQQAAPGSSTPNSHCTRQLAAPTTDGSKSHSQTYLDTDYLGCQTIGMSESAGIAFLASKNIVTRISNRDGIEFPLTADYSESRVNLTVTRSVITAYNVG
jgi:hypothetical protein